MGWTCGFFAIALAVIAYRSDDPQLRPWLFGFAAFNALAVLLMWAEGSPYLFQSAPVDPDDVQPAWRR